MSQKPKPYDYFYNKRQEQKKEAKESAGFDLFEKIIIVFSLFIYLLIFPPFLKDQTLAGHDVGAHLTYLRLFADALSQGQFPVRWVEWVAGGQNQPLFNFYQPLLYYLGQIPHILGSDILNSLYQTILFSWLFSGFITFLFVKNLTKNTLAGLAASFVYVFAPYHIVDVFVRTAYPETLALAFAPGLFYAIERYFATQKRIYIGLLAIFFAAIFTSHPPTLIMFSFPFLLFLIYLFYNDYKEKVSPNILLKKSLGMFFGLALGSGLASFFAIPAFLQQNLVKSPSLNVGYLDFHTHFACLMQLVWSDWGYGTSTEGCMDKMSFQVGILNWIIIIIAVITLLYYLQKKINHKSNLLNLIFLITAFFGMYMTLSFSQPFWEGLPYLSFLQFPWRFLSVVIFSSAVLTGLLFNYLNNKTYKLILYIAIALTAPLLTFTYLAPAAYLSKDYFAQDSPKFYQGIAQGQKGGTAELSYMPKNTQVLPDPQFVPLSEIEVSDKNAKIEVLKNDFANKKYIVTTTKDSEVKLFIHYFPGWQFSLNGEKIQAYYSDIYGFSRFAINAGENKINAEFINTPIVNLANMISLVSFIILIILLLTSGKIPKLSGKIDLTKEP